MTRNVMRSLFLLALFATLLRSAHGDDWAMGVLVEYDRTEAFRARLRASVRPVVVRPPNAGPILLPGQVVTAVAVTTASGPRLLAPASLLASGRTVEVVLPGGSRTPVKIARVDAYGEIMVLSCTPWPTELRPLRLAPESAVQAATPALLLSNVTSPGMEVVSRVELVGPITEPGTVGGMAWLTTAPVPDGSPLLDERDEVLALPYAPYGPNTTLGAVASRLRELLEPRERPAEETGRVSERPAAGTQLRK